MAMPVAAQLLDPVQSAPVDNESDEDRAERSKKHCFL